MQPKNIVNPPQKCHPKKSPKKNAHNYSKFVVNMPTFIYIRQMRMFICMNMPKSLIKYDAASNAVKKETKTV